MWVGAIRLTVKTEDAPYAGTDSLLQASVRRDGDSLVLLNLDYPTEDDHVHRGRLRSD